MYLCVPACTMGVLCVYYACTVHVLCVYYACTMGVLCVYYACIYVLCSHDDDVYSILHDHLPVIYNGVSLGSLTADEFLLLSITIDVAGIYVVRLSALRV